MASIIHHNRRHCSVCNEGKILIKSLYLTAKRLTDEFPKKSWTKLGVNKLFKSCNIQAQLRGGQAVADHAVPALKKTLSFFVRSSHSLPLTVFCRLSGEATENTFRRQRKQSQWHTAETSEAKT